MLGKLDIKSRPLRLGLLVDLKNKSSIERAITINSTLWGGYYNPLIPIFKSTPRNWDSTSVRLPTPKAIFEGYLRAFDPDVLVTCFDGPFPEYVGGAGRSIIASGDIWPQGMNAKSEPNWGIGLFDVLNLVYKDHFRFVERFPHEVKLLRFPRKERLFWAAVFGLLPPQVDKTLVAWYGKAIPITFESASFKALRQFLGNSRIFYPHRLSRYRLTETSRSWTGDRNTLFFMDGTRSLDIVDFWNLRAAGRRVVPVPTQSTDDKELQKIVREFIKFADHPAPQNPTFQMGATFIRSRFTTTEQMTRYANRMRVESAPPRVSLQHWYPRIWDDFGRDADHVEPPAIYFTEREIDLPGEGKEIRFAAVVPDFLERLGLTDQPRLANDIDLSVYGADEYIASVVPTQSGNNVMRVVAELGAYRDDWRIGHRGLVKLLKYKSNIYWTIPSAQEVFFAWLRDLGWIPQASPSGLIANQIHKQLRGWTAWFNDSALHFLEKMTTGKYADRGADASEIGNRLATTDPTGGFRIPRDRLFDQLLERDVFVVGYENQCPRCFRHSWRSLREFDALLSCPKCLHSYRANRHVTTGRWKYKTAGPFSIGGYADGSYCVLASIDFFARRLHHLAVTPATSFNATKSSYDLEADFGILWREENIRGRSDGVIFGECKSYCEFKESDFDRMRKLAAEFPGSVLAFCTLRQNLTAYETEEIKKIAKAGREYWKANRPINPVCVLTGGELTNHIGPPYCWEGLGIKDQFRWIVGLMDFCNATQQIHLGMQNWTEEWHKKWERRNRKSTNKNKPEMQAPPPATN